MGWKKPFFGLMALVFAHVETPEAWAKPTFPPPSTPAITAPSGKTFQFDANTLLTPGTGAGPLQWSIPPGTVPPPPSWVSVGRASGIITINGVAGSNDTFTFNLQVANDPVSIDGGSIAQVSLKLYTIPEWTGAVADLGTTMETANLSFDLNSIARDPAGKALTFALVDPSGKFPTWINATKIAQGILTGIPARKDVTPKFDGFSFRATSASGGVSEVPGQGAVSLFFRGPRWTANPLVLPDATQGTLYSQTLNVPAFLNYSEGMLAPLSCSIVAGGTNAGWITKMSADGTCTLSGTPSQANAGAVTFQVTASATYNGKVFTDTTTFTTNVKLVPPTWKANPIVLPNALAGVAYGPQDLITQINNAVGSTLQYSIVAGSGPVWASLTSAGKFGGTPQVANLGLNEWTVQVTDGQNTVPTKVQVTVQKRPPAWTANPIVLPPGLAGVVYGPQDIKNKATDPDGAALTFSIVAGSGPAWGTISADGKFAGTPPLANIGLNEWTVAVSNGSSSAFTQLQVTIGKRPPTINNPILLPNALAGLAYGPQDVSAQGNDPDGAGLTWSIVAGSGPAWASMSADGKVTGTPLKANLGLNSWTVEVTNGTNKVTATMQLSVVNAPPVWSANPIILPTATAGVAYGPQDISSLATSPSGAALTYSIVAGTGPTPNWGTLTPQGKFSGTAAVANVGVGTWTVSVTDGGNTVTTKMQVTVVKRPPVWTVDPIVLPDGTAGFPYAVTDISSNASDPDGAKLTFSIVAGSGPTWGKLSADGKFSGSPSLAHLGLNQWTVQVSNGNSSATATLQVNIRKSAPVWSKNPILLPNAQAELPYAVQDISSFATDPDGASLTFSIVAGSGPSWGQLSPDGKFSGTPLKANLGVNTWMVEVTNGPSKATTTLQVTVVNAPPVWSANPILLPTATAGVPYGPQDIGSFAKSPSGAALTYSLVPGTGPAPAWGKMTADGKFTGTPAVANVGVNVWTVSVTDGDNTVSTKMQITVVKRPPVWAADPIVLPDGSAGVAYPLTDISTKASDPDGIKLTFSLVAGSGPAWGKLSADGKFSGTPLLANIGLNEWVVSVSNGFSSATTHLQITVKLGPPAWTMNPIVLPNATAGVAYGPLDLSGFAKSPSGASLTYSITASPAPAWGTITSDGKFSGTPAVANVGLDVWTLTVNDGSNTVSTQLHITVVKRPPVWSVNPIVLPDGTATIAYPDTDISAKASDPDSLSLNYTIVPGSGPAWGTLTPDGKFSGTPAAANVGMNEWTVQANNGINTADVKLRVNIKAGPPVWTANPVILPDALTGLLYGPQDLAKFVKAAIGTPLSFKMATAGGPAWAMLAADGKFTGTPSRNDVGLNKWNVEVSDGVNTPVVAEVQVMVVKRPPVWSKNPIILPAAPIGDNYDHDLSTYASDPDPGETLKFMQTTASPWIFVTAAGRVVGTPAATDLGLNKITVRVTNLEGVFADVEVQIQVIQKAKPPAWTVATIDLGTATVGQRFSFDLNPFVKDPNGLPVKFRKAAAAPAWMSVSANGQVTGTPAIGDLGPYTTIFEASDDNLVWIAVDAFGKVIKQIKPPVLNAAALSFTVRVGEDFKENLNQAKYVTSPDGLDLTFKLLDGEPWITVAADGKMQILPVLANLGDHVFQLEVKDSEGATAQAPLKVKVIPAGKPPVLEDPIRYDAVINKPFNADLTTKVTGDGPFTFSKESGKGWLTVNASGVLEGTPTVLGEDFFGIKVTSASGKSAATLIIRVIPDTPDEDSVVIDAPVPGARVDNIWVVGNNPDPCSGAHCLITKLKENIDVYYDALKAADIHHYGVYLSSDACLYTTPIKDSRGKVLMAWDDSLWVKSFNNRVDRSPGRKDWSSLLVANWQFLYTAGSSIPAPFFAGRVPVETLYVSDEADSYSRAYAAWMPIKNWSPTDYLDYFKGIYGKYKKSHRTSALAIDSSAYKTVVTGTGGKYYTYGAVNTRASLADYAKQVVFRAYVNAKDKVKLSKVPADPSTIKVAIAGKSLAADQWKYDAASNSVEVYWSLIDINQFKSGDKLVISYGASSRVAKN